MSSSEIHQSALTVVLRLVVTVLGVLALVAGVVLVIAEPDEYGGWVLLSTGVVVAVLAARRRQQMGDGLILRRSGLRSGG